MFVTHGETGHKWQSIRDTKSRYLSSRCIICSVFEPSTCQKSLYKGIVQPKMKMCWKYSPLGHPRCRWVCFFIRFGEMCHCTSVSAMDALQWMGAVRMRVNGCSAVNGCRQNESQWMLCSEWVPSEWESMDALQWMGAVRMRVNGCSAVNGCRQNESQWMLCSEWVPSEWESMNALQWMGAVRMRVNGCSAVNGCLQNESLIKTSHHSSPSVNIWRSCMSVRNRSIKSSFKLLLLAKIWVHNP